jgi:hypothetical protein
LKRDKRDDSDRHKPRAKFEKQSQETAPHNVENETIEVRVRKESHARDYHKTASGKGKRQAKLKTGSSGTVNALKENAILRPAVQLVVRHPNLRRIVMDETKLLLKKKAITPLWIVALFVSFTELVLGVVVTQTQGGIQIALTVFVLAFPVLIAGAFFLILWHKSYVFYPPTEFGDQTNVLDYVRAMQGKLALDNQMQNIQEAVRTTLMSEKVITELIHASSIKSDAEIEKKVEQILDAASDSAVKKIQEVGFITINTTLLLKNKGSIWHEPYDPNEPVSAFTDILYFKMRPEVPPFTYGSRWVLKDYETGRVFEELGSKYPNDKLPLSEAGIHAGMTLLVVPPEKAQEPER